MKSKHVCEAERSSSDIISTLPQTILDIILCLLTTKEAARTSILSREWRYKWIIIPKLGFSHYKLARRNMGMGCKPCYNIRQILILHQGPIRELNLTLDRHEEDNCLELDQIILHFSRNHTVKILTICGWGFGSHWYKLPISVFSFHHLTDLNLLYVDLDHPPILTGFGSLRSLVLDDVAISIKSLLHLLSNCPSLKSLTLLISGLTFDDDKCTFNELFKCLPVIEHITTWIYVFEWLKLGLVPQELPTSLFHLKYFCLQETFPIGGYGLAFLLVLIKCSLNLEKIKIERNGCDDCDVAYSVVFEEYSDVWLEHLNELDIDSFSNTKPEMEFVKFILARSPKLKKVSIYSAVDDLYQESQIFRSLNFLKN